MASLSMTVFGDLERPGEGAWMRTFFWDLRLRCWTPASSSSSISLDSWRRTGSSSSPFCSPMSPVSVHEEPSEE